MLFQNEATNYRAFLLKTYVLFLFISVSSKVFAQSTIQDSTNISGEPKFFVGSTHSGDVRSIDFSYDGTLLTSVADEFYGTGDNRILVWQLKTGNVIQIFNDSTKDVDHVKFLKNNQIVTYSSNICVVWNVNTGELVKKFKGASYLSSDGSYLTIEDNYNIHIYKTDDWSEISNHFKNSIPGELFISPHGDYTVSIEESVPLDTATNKPSTRYDHINLSLNIWSNTDGILLKSFFIGSRPTTALNTSILFLPDDRHILFGTGMNGAQITEIDMTGKDLPVYINKPDNASYVSVAAVNESGTLLCTSYSTDIYAKQNGALNLWKIDQPDKPILLTTYENELYAAAFSHDGRFLAVAGADKTIHIWDIIKKKDIQSLGGQSNPIQALVFSKDGKYFANSSGDGIIKVWNIQQGVLFGTINAKAHVMGKPIVRSIAFSPDGKAILYGGFGAVDMTSLNDLSKTKSINIPFANKDEYLNVINIDDVLYSPDGSIIGETEPGRGIVRLYSISSGEEINRYPYSIMKPFISNDSKTLVTTDDENCYLFDIKSGIQIRKIEKFKPLAFTSDDALGGLKTINGKQHFVIVDLKGGHIEQMAEIDKADLRLYVLSPDKKNIAATDNSNSIYIWNIKSGKELTHIVAQADSVETLEFTNNGNGIISSNKEGAIKIWEIDNQELIGNIYSLGYGDWLAVNKQGYFDGSPAAWSKSYWRFSKNLYDFVPLEQYFNEFFYPGLLSTFFNVQRINTSSNIKSKDRRQPNVILKINKKFLVGSQTSREIPITIIVHEAGSDVNHRSGCGVRDLRVFRNGFLVKIWRGELSLTNGVVSKQFSLQLIPGQNNFQIYCYNSQNVRSLTSSVDISGDKSLYRKPKMFILSVGINHYKFVPGDSLRFAASDAKTFSMEVERQQHLMNAAADIEITNLIDSSASKNEIIDEIKKISSKAQPEDIVLMFFSLHGERDNDNFYFITYDTQIKKLEQSNNQSTLDAKLKNAISSKEIEKLFDELNAKRLVLIIDACRSGQILEATDERQGPLNIKGLSQLAYEKGMYILAATKTNDEASEEVALKHGKLTYALIKDGLTNGFADLEPVDGTITLREWLNYPTIRVPQYSNEEQVNLITIFPDKRTQYFYRKKIKTNFIQQPVLLFRKDMPVDTVAIALRAPGLSDIKSNSSSQFVFSNDISLERNKQLIDTARELYYKRNYKEAYENLREAYKIQQDNIMTLTFLGHNYFGEGDYTTAKKYYLSVLNIRPDYCRNYLRVAACDEQLMDYNSEILDLRQGLSIDPDDAEVNYKLGSALLYKNDSKNAIEPFKTALVNCEDPKDLSDYSYSLGMAYFCSGKFTDAALAFKQSYMQSRDNHSSNLLPLYLLYRLGGSNEMANEYLKETVNITDTADWRTPVFKFFRHEITEDTFKKNAHSPDNLIRVNAILAIEYYLEGKKKKAENYWKILERNPNTQLGAYMMAREVLAKNSN